MLADAPVMAMLPVVDMARARKFYEDTLGLPCKGVLPNGSVVYACSGGTIGLYQRATPTQADHTALSFEVKDIGAMMARLRQKGVRFEEYDFPGLKTVDSIATQGSEKAAWFKDPEGNILCIHQNL